MHTPFSFPPPRHYFGNCSCLQVSLFKAMAACCMLEGLEFLLEWGKVSGTSARFIIRKGKSTPLGFKGGNLTGRASQSSVGCFCSLCSSLQEASGPLGLMTGLFQIDLLGGDQLSSLLARVCCPVPHCPSFFQSLFYRGGGTLQNSLSRHGGRGLSLGPFGVSLGLTIALGVEAEVADLFPQSPVK